MKKFFVALMALSLLIVSVSNSMGAGPTAKPLFCVPSTSAHTEIVIERNQIDMTVPQTTIAVAKSNMEKANSYLNTTAGGKANLVAACDSDGKTKVSVINGPTTDSSFDSIVATAQAAGFNANSVHYLILYDDWSLNGIANSGTHYAGDVAKYAVVYGSFQNVGPTYYFGPIETMIHELTHTFGPVDPGAPHSNPNGTRHCTDGSGKDIMCLEAGTGQKTFVYDFNKDDYANLAPAAGTWLKLNPSKNMLACDNVYVHFTSTSCAS